MGFIDNKRIYCIVIEVAMIVSKKEVVKMLKVVKAWVR